MIELDKLTKRFGSFTAVDNLSFTVETGQILGFLGPNGAGKTTTMKMLTGYLTPTSGSARVCGFDVSRQPLEVKRRIGYVPEGAPAWPDMTVEGFLSFIAGIRRLDGAAARSAIADVVEKTHLQPVLNQPIETLSKGFKRRVGLAQALMHDPEVLILDEPTDGLDPNQKHEVRNLIKRMSGEKAIIVSTHILEEVEAVCSRAMIIADGRILADGTPEELESRATEHNRIRLHISDADKVNEAAHLLGGLPGVGLVDNLGDGQLTLRPAGGKDLSAEVAGLLRDRQIAFDRLQVERGRLDEVFRNITTGEAGIEQEAENA